MSIALLNQKGGSGKTTIATHLADAYRRSGIDTAILDLDPQRSATHWCKAGGEVPVHTAPLGSDPSSLRMSDVASLIADHRGVSRLILDCAGRLDRLIGVVERTADLVIIPARPSPLDIWATAPIVQRLAAYQAIHGSPLIRSMVSQAVDKTLLAREVTTALEALGVPTLESRTHMRVLYADSLGRGETVYSRSEADPAAQEITTLAFEIEEVLKNEQET